MKHFTKGIAMKVQIIATKTCSHRAQLERMLQQENIAYEVAFLEDHAELMEKYQIFHSPNLRRDGEIVFRARPGASLPSAMELKSILDS